MKKPRQIKLKRPCSNCPFLDSPESIAHTLRPGRLDGIKVGLMANDMQPFLCHKTLSGHEDDHGEYNESGKESHCMGAMAWLYKQGRFNVPMRITAHLDSTWIDDQKASAMLVID